jgi:hypothetical protein
MLPLARDIRKTIYSSSFKLEKILHAFTHVIFMVMRSQNSGQYLCNWHFTWDKMSRIHNDWLSNSAQCLPYATSCTFIFPTLSHRIFLILFYTWYWCFTVFDSGDLFVSSLFLNVDRVLFTLSFNAGFVSWGFWMPHDTFLRASNHFVHYFLKCYIS